MGLLSSDSKEEAGCTAHHWGEYSISWQRTRFNTLEKPSDRRSKTIEQLHGNVERGFFVLQTYEVAMCQHEGCGARDTRPGQKIYLPIGATTIDKHDALEIHDFLEDENPLEDKS